MPGIPYVLGVTVLVLAAGCQFAGQTPVPTETLAPSPTEMSTATVGPTLLPTLLPTPTEPPPRATETWRRVADFPPPGVIITSVIAGGPGFVAVGHVGEVRCQGVERGVIWTSADGYDWTQADVPGLTNVALGRIVSAGNLFAFGQVGSLECGGDRVVLRSPDGRTWEQLPADLSEIQELDTVGAIDSTLVALGYSEEGDGYGWGAWTSGDGVNWRRSPEAPESSLSFTDVLSLGGTAVAIPDYWAPKAAWYSIDGGGTWRESGPDLRFLFNTIGAAAGNDQVVVVGSGCCSRPRVEVGVSISSADGRSWASSAAFRDVPGAVVALPDGYLAVGRSNWISHDGLDWRVGPPIPEFDSRSHTVAVSGYQGVFVLNGELAWVASNDALDVGAWSESPPAAEMPEIGVRYPVELFMHCGFPQILFELGTWSPDPPIDDINPPPGFKENDRGWLTQISAEELRYESRNGPTVTLRPSDPEGGFCA